MTIFSTLVAMMTFPASSAESELVERVRGNLERLRERISASGRDPSSVRIVAVTKTFSLSYVNAAAAVGLDTVGENYVEELCAKRDEVPEVRVRWHYLGALQTNKISRILGCADLISGVSRARELERIASAPRPLYVQVDFTGQSGRNGCAPSEVAELIARARDLALDVRGLMTVAPPDPAGARAAFGSTRRLVDAHGLDECSMGMSNDLEIACDEGTSELRIGRALFGPRDTTVALP